MSELQPGMLAMVIGSVRPESPHLGKVVTLKDKGCHDVFGEFWNIEPLDLDACRALTKHLMPLPPLSDPLDQKQQQELHG